MKRLFEHSTLRTRIAAVAFLAFAAFVVPAQAIPTLQVFIEGATYDYDTETWVTNQTDFTLLVIGNTGQVGTIFDVQLTAAFLTHETGSITLTPTTSGVLTDPSTPIAPTYDASVGGDGTVPVMSNGNPLPRHGIFGPGVSFHQWDLGDLTATDSPIGDFSEGFPTSFPQSGQVNAYNVSISGYSMVHFDTFNHVDAPQDVLFGPFSHDAGAVVPEPGTFVLLGLGLAGSGATWIRRRKRGAIDLKK